MNSLEKAEKLKRRTKNLAIRTRKPLLFVTSLAGCVILGKQLLRSGTSVAANYRAVCRARSQAEFIAKMGLSVEEADETVFWLELLGETGVVSRKRTQDLLQEANELVAIFGASLRTSMHGVN